MNSYQLQAKMKDGTLINLDFLNSFLEGNRLSDIDKFTNTYSYWDFLGVVEPYLTGVRVEEIESFVIAIRGKNYHYSVCFENPYLSALFRDSAIDNSWDPQIFTGSPSFIEMRRFLFADIDQKGKQFLESYPYQNQLLKKVNKYTSIIPLSEEDIYEREVLKGQILKEMKSYKTYRSLCIYRKKLEGKRKPTNPTLKKESVKKPTILPDTGVIIYKDNEDGIVTRYNCLWENSIGEEREEFLEEDEIKEMVKTYGEN